MKKSSKQKKNKQQHKSQPQELVIATSGEEQQLLTSDGIDAVLPSPSMPVEPALGDAETDPSPQQNAPLTMAAVLKQKTALLAQNQQRSQWNQQRKAGKMVNAHVPKRFNRGG